MKTSRNQNNLSASNTVGQATNDTEKEVEIEVWIEPVEEKKK